jgi:hypothetical protein
MRLPNMGRSLVAEIQEKLSELTVEKVSAALQTEFVPNSFSLAIFLSLERCGVPEKIADRLRAAGVSTMHELLRLGIETIRVRARLKYAEIQALQTRLVSFRLRLGSHPPRWITKHLEELRAAFGETAALGTVDHVNAPYRFEKLEGRSHWLLEEVPDEVSALVLEHLAANSAHKSDAGHSC